MEQITAEQMWDAFIVHLNKVDPLMFVDGKKQKQLPHQSFLGSIEKYRKIFIDANVVEK